MTIVEEGFMSTEGTAKLTQAANDMLDYCELCETKGNEFIKIANCILTREEYYDFLELYRRFDNNFGILESLVSQVTYPTTILQAVSISAVIKEIQRNIDELVKVMEISDIRLETQEINVNMARLMEKLINFMEFDAIDYDDLNEAMNRTFIILKVVDIFDKEYKRAYYPMNVLHLVSFDTKSEAYSYALEHGISKDFILNRHGHLL
ncbi:MAG: hypothetical protein K2G70_00125 [Turicibacter sp.]|nr:hypothetical protein [Turicibacter sp.]